MILKIPRSEMIGKIYLCCVAPFIFVWPLQSLAQTPVPMVFNAPQNQPPSTSSTPPAQAQTVLRLADLEQMALNANPTLAQAEAAIRAAEGRRVQAGLFPNPIIGYAGEELSTRAFKDKSEHFVFFEQEIPLGGKLRKSQNILAQEKLQTEQAASAQKQRVLNAVRRLYYQALGAQTMSEVRQQLVTLTQEAVKTTGELFNVGQADRPDVLEIEVEQQRAQIDLLMVENERAQVWQQIGALIGNPLLQPASLAGHLEQGLPLLNQETALAELLRQSPEIKRVQAGIERAKATLVRAKAEPLPDLFVRGGFGYSNEVLESNNPRLAGRRTGPEGKLEVGLRLPLFNRNQGGIAVAKAELEIAEREKQRLELALRARLAMTFREYQNAQQMAERYEKQIVPRAQQAYDLYLTRFRQMAAAYPQVLIAQRTLIQVRADYIRALVEAWQNAVQIQGFLLTGGLDAPMSSDAGPSFGNQPEGGK